jgi:hypothetical protein
MGWRSDAMETTRRMADETGRDGTGCNGGEERDGMRRNGGGVWSIAG